MAILSEQSVHLGNVGVNDPPEVRRVGGDMERSVRPPGHKYLLAGDSLSFYFSMLMFLYCTPVLYCTVHLYMSRSHQRTHSSLPGSGSSPRKRRILVTSATRPSSTALNRVPQFKLQLQYLQGAVQVIRSSNNP